MSKESDAVASMKNQLNQMYTVKQAEGASGREPMIITRGWMDKHSQSGTHRYLQTEYYQGSWPVVTFEPVTIGDELFNLGLIHCNLPIHGNLFAPGQFIQLKPEESTDGTQILQISSVEQAGPDDYHMSFALPWMIKTKTLLGEDGPDLGRSSAVSVDNVSFIIAVE